uniref:Uncharacterized protein n=1 Tax=Oryza meridionalis TaxID=40149 RepID=A0A0E0EF90_9ORYZ
MSTLGACTYAGDSRNSKRRRTTASATLASMSAIFWPMHTRAPPPNGMNAIGWRRRPPSSSAANLAGLNSAASSPHAAASWWTAMIGIITSVPAGTTHPPSSTSSFAVRIIATAGGYSLSVATAADGDDLAAGTFLPLRVHGERDGGPGEEVGQRLLPGEEEVLALLDDLARRHRRRHEAHELPHAAAAIAAIIGVVAMAAAAALQAGDELGEVAPDLPVELPHAAVLPRGEEPVPGDVHLAVRLGGVAGELVLEPEHGGAVVVVPAAERGERDGLLRHALEPLGDKGRTRGRMSWEVGGSMGREAASTMRRTSSIELPTKNRYPGPRTPCAAKCRSTRRGRHHSASAALAAAAYTATHAAAATATAAAPPHVHAHDAHMAR